ncbi:MAG: DUF6270 domain-containing protein [Limibaculum sp.]
MRDIVLYGSCVSRDPLAMVENDFTVSYFHARSTILSLASERPVPGIDPDSLVSEKPFNQRCFRTDAAKSFRTDFSGHLLIFDFIDDRFASGAAGSSVFTLNPMALRDNPHLARIPVTRIDPRMEQDQHHVAAAVETLARRFARLFRDNLLVLHRTFFDPDYTGPGSAPAMIRQINGYYNFLYELIEQNWPLAHTIDLRDRITTPPDHRWGHKPFHYGRDYDLAFIKALDRIAR